MGFFTRDIYGQAALVEALEGIDFPISKYNIISEFGDREVKWFKNAEPVSLGDIVERLDYRVFESMNDIIEAVSREITIV